MYRFVPHVTAIAHVTVIVSVLCTPTLASWKSAIEDTVQAGVHAVRNFRTGGRSLLQMATIAPLRTQPYDLFGEKALCYTCHTRAHQWNPKLVDEYREDVIYMANYSEALASEREEGREEGAEQRDIDLARAWHTKGQPISQISDLLGRDETWVHMATTSPDKERAAEDERA